MNLRSIVVGVLLIAFSNGATPSEHKIAVTHHFEFFSNPWVNMHHFLYQAAKGSTLRRTITEQETAITAQLSELERQLLEQSIAYYQANVIDRDLLFNIGLSEAKSFLSNSTGNQLAIDDSDNASLYQTLNSFRALYEKHYWKLHDQANRAKFSENKSLVRKIEKPVMARFSQLAQTELPLHKIRVDITATANWAGGYTTIDPIIHVVLSSTRTNLMGSQWLELLIHEPGHYLVGPRNNFIGDTITEVAERNSLKTSRSLWHAVLFYFSGIAVKEALAEEGIDHRLYMKINNVFSRHHATLPYLDPYINGDVTFDAALQASVDASEDNK